MGRSCRKFSLALLVFAPCGHAQFSDLAVTDDGLRLYFATPLRLASESGQGLPPGAAIYSIAGGAIDRVTFPPGLGPLPFHLLSHGNPQVNADGRVFSYTSYNNCYGGSACITFPSTSTSFLTVDGRAYGPLKGEAQISRNGRYALNYRTICCPIPAQPDVIEFRDLLTGATVLPPLPPAGRRQALTSGGAALLLNRQSGSLVLWTPQSSRNLSTAALVRSAIVNDLGTWIVYETSAGSQADLRAFEIASGHDFLLASRSVEFWNSPVFGSSISNDGATVLYLAAQTWIIHPDGTERRQLTSLSQDVSEAIISGNGQSAIAVSGGRLLSIDVAGGVVSELIAATPTCYPATQALAPGSLFPLKGTALAASTQTASAPLPTELAGTQLLMNGAPLLLLSVSPTEIWFQVPWEAPPGTIAALSLNYGSPFNGCSVAMPLSGRAPYFIPDETGSVIFLHQGLGGLVTRQSPAEPGEVVTAYALGLGGVSPSVPTGVPTPLDRLYPLNWPFACYQGSQFQDGPPLDVTFAGLAPGMTGVYQVNIRVPDVVPPDSILLLNCGTPGNVDERGNAFIPVASAN